MYFNNTLVIFYKNDQPQTDLIVLGVKEMSANKANFLQKINELY